MKLKLDFYSYARQKHSLPASALRDVILLCKDVVKDRRKVQEVKKLSANPYTLVKKVKLKLQSNHFRGAAHQIKQEVAVVKVPETRIFKAAGVTGIRIHYNSVENIMHQLQNGDLFPLAISM